MQPRRKHGWTFRKVQKVPQFHALEVSSIPPVSPIHTWASLVSCILGSNLQQTRASASHQIFPDFEMLAVWRLHSFRYFLALWPVIKMFSQTPVFLFHTHNNFEMYYCWETPFLLPTSPQREALAEAKEVFTVTSWEKVTHSLDLIKFSKAGPRTDTQELQSEYLHCFIFFSKIPCPLFKK